MHRLAALPGEGLSGRDAGVPVELVEQPPAPIILLSSADSDLTSVERLLEQEPTLLGAELRALNLATLSHPALVDHYLATTVRAAQLVLVRLLGDRGYWSYGLDQLQQWAAAQPNRQLVVLAGTAEHEQSLAALGTIPMPLALGLGACLRTGGPTNVRRVLLALADLLASRTPDPPIPEALPDPLPHDWRAEPGARVGLILYRSLLQAGDLGLMDAALDALRDQGLSPRALWVSGLRDLAVQRGVIDLLKREAVELVLCSTAFASVLLEDAGLGAPLWDALGVPVLQLLTSHQSQQRWRESSIGLGPVDLTMQVALPELDGRITTRVGAFKEILGASERLASALHGLQPESERLSWIAALAAHWAALRTTPRHEKRVALVLANYPARNSRIANGVGLDTPASVLLMLQWLHQGGYSLHESHGSAAAPMLPEDGTALVKRLLEGRSNDPESGHRPPLGHLPRSRYLSWYATLPAEGRQRLESVWGPPEADLALEGKSQAGFPIHGLRYGHVVLLIQPERGYDRDPSLNYHNPDLPPTHAYLAAYLWLRQEFAAHVVVHVGKHGNLEWLPGKGVGLSSDCFPEWALGPLPHLYPFIVNDPGEGSQAKRRAQAVILDHLTPPLGRAGLHGDLQRLEGLLDEYWEANQLGAQRQGLLREALAQQLESLELPLAGGDLDARLDAADGYLCELKEAQIRLGLHTYGTLPEPDRLAELLLCLARPPEGERPGLTQAMAADLMLELDPWSDEEATPLSAEDQQRLSWLMPPAAEAGSLRRVGDAVAWLETEALKLVRRTLQEWPTAGLLLPGLAVPPATSLDPRLLRPESRTQAVLAQLRQQMIPRLLACGEAERVAFLAGLDGQRIAAGPSGAPTRGRSDLLPTGRNFYSVDLRGLPTEAAWDLGRRSAELLLELHLQDQGEHLQRLALSVWGTATMRNGGEDIAQALALMGVRPQWDGPTRRLVGLEVIPLEVLGRPRVDVTLRISGLFRDAFPQLVGWFNQATALVASLDESPQSNPLAAAARADGGCGRIYGSAPGAYGAGLQGLIESGHWDQRADLGQAFLNWSSWRYEGQGEAVADRSGLERRLAAVQVVLHNQDNREHDLLDSDDYYQFQGGLSAAIESLTGEAPALWFGDHSRQQRPRLHRLEREFDKVLRSRVLNPRWIQAMVAHGYKGAFEMAASLDYLFAYDASTGRVPDWSYEAIAAHWLENAEVQAFLRRDNPWALRDMAERLLEAHHRGLWSGAREGRLAQLRQLVLESEALVEGSPSSSPPAGPEQPR
ncbi:MAG: cobaltochelatase subunit CobN [Cyanobacteriota bacterium]|nr:cobaltochelatase subunit CobN [Cyanobacteriota bacterium]